MTNQEIINGLNELLTKNYDAERGFKTVAEKTEDPRTKSFCMAKAQNRYNYGHEIKDIIKSLNGEPQKGTSTIGDMHNAWINVRSVLSFDKEEAVLEEVENGEKASLDDYDKFLSNSGLPTNIRSKIEDQRNAIANTLKTAEVMEETR